MAGEFGDRQAGEQEASKQGEGAGVGRQGPQEVGAGLKAEVLARGTETAARPDAAEATAGVAEQGVETA